MHGNFFLNLSFLYDRKKKKKHLLFKNDVVPNICFSYLSYLANNALSIVLITLCLNLRNY